MKLTAGLTLPCSTSSQIAHSVVANHVQCLVSTHRRQSAVSQPVLLLLPFRASSRPSSRLAKQGARCAMYVPSDSFGGKSPERKAADALRNLFTFVAVRVVMAQLEGSGRGALGSYNAQAYTDLVSFLEENPLRDGDAWLSLLLRRNEMLAMRIMEVRLAYSADDFQWHKCEQLATQGIQEGNMALMRKYAETAFTSASAERACQLPRQDDGAA